MQKFWEISRQIHDFLTWKQVECPFEKDKKIQTYLLTAPIYSEEGKILCLGVKIQNMQMKNIYMQKHIVLVILKVLSLPYWLLMRTNFIMKTARLHLLYCNP